MSDDFCLLHGHDHMKFDRGPIPYCAECDWESALENKRALDRLERACGNQNPVFAFTTKESD